MRCKTCDYPLWNLKARKCPECGSAFVPGDHEFVANSVRFCCPECDQAYYGTTEQGHLEPAAFTCVKCDRYIRMDDMVLRPAEGVAETQTQVDVVPWLERERGRIPFKAWVRTVGGAMVGPGRMMRVVPQGSTASAWGFAIVTAGVIFLLGLGAPVFVVGLLMAIFGSSDWMQPLASGAGLVLAGTAAYLLLIVVWGAVTHVALLLTGGTEHSIGRTYQAICFSLGGNITSAFPILGIYPFQVVGLCWWSVSAVLMVMHGQRVSGTRAAFATLVLPVCGVLLVALAMVGAMFWGMSQARIQTNLATVGQQETECLVVLDALADYVVANDGQWPRHALEVVSGGQLAGWDLVAGNSQTFPAEVPVAGGTLGGVADLPDATLETMTDTAAESLPVDVVAHRLGDFVFTYHGLPTGEDTPPVPGEELWYVVLAVDPNQNAIIALHDVIVVGKGDGTVESIPVADFDARLAEQNGLRATHGLAPLPRPETVLHEVPATGN